MWLLIEKSTNIVRDIQGQCPTATSDFECVEDKGLNDRAKVGYTYDKQGKAYIAPPLAPIRQSELSNTQLTAKLDQIQTQLDSISVAQPVLGAAQPQQNNLVYIPIALIVATIGFIVGLKLRK